MASSKDFDLAERFGGSTATPHSPLPWRFDTSLDAPWHKGMTSRELRDISGVVDAAGKTVNLTGFALGGSVARIDNSELVVRAVNAHEALVEALELALRNEQSRLYMLPASDDYATSAQKDILSAAIGTFHAALALAKGETR